MAAEAARDAGRAILRRYSQGAIAVETKLDNSPVTIADREANAVILAALTAAFPDDAILSEESPDNRRRLGKARVWIVDPLDGTRDFVARTGDFCVHVGLAVEGIATVYDFHATILHLLGLDHERLTFYHNGTERRLTDVHGHVIREVLA